MLTLIWFEVTLLSWVLFSVVSFLVMVLLFSVALWVAWASPRSFLTQAMDASLLNSELLILASLVEVARRPSFPTQVVGSLSWLSFLEVVMEAASRQRLDLVGDSLALVLVLFPPLECFSILL